MFKQKRAFAYVTAGLALTVFIAACGLPSQGRNARRDPLEPDPSSRQPLAYYQQQLAEFPLRLKSYNLHSSERRSPVVIKELHVIHDDVRDEILVIDKDQGTNNMWSIDAYDFTLHWRTPIEKRTEYDPIPTRNYVVLMDNTGQYQAYDRLSAPRLGESRLVTHGRFEGDTFPSARPASNDTHIFMPATNTNAIKGLSMISNARGEGPETWRFPQTGSIRDTVFMQISTPPAADRETVVFVNNNHRLYMIDAQTGEYRADPNLEAHVRTVPLLHDDLVFVGSDSGQLYAWQKSGQSAWIVTLDGLPYGNIFVEDRWVFVRTLEIYDKLILTDDGTSYVKRAALRPGQLMAFKYELRDVPGDRPVYYVKDGDPSTPYKKEPIWTEPDVGQKILMLNGNHLFILYEEKEEFLSRAEKARLKSEGRIVKKSEELRTISRTIRVVDVNTGIQIRPEWSFNMMDFPHIVGSMEERDRAIYLGTNDGFVFKLYGKNRRSAGGK